MRKIFLFLFALPMMAQAQSKADSTTIKMMSDEIMKNGKAYDLLRELTKDIGGRLAGSPQQQNAAIWGKRHMESFKPDQVFMQPCKTPNWQRGGKDFSAVVAADGKAMIDKLEVLALGNSLSSNGLVEADLLAVANFDELEKRKDEVKGKIVYYHSQFDPTNIQTFKSYGEAGAYRRAGASRAAKYGAVGVMIHSLSTAPDNAPHTGSMVYDEAYPKIPAIALGPNDAKKIWAQSRNKQLRVQMQTYGFFQPDADENNVIAELKGTEFPDQYIAIASGKQVYNGKNLEVYKLVPTDDELEWVISTLWIDPVESLVYKTFTTTKENGSFEITMEYGAYANYGLPSKIIFGFNTKDYKLPNGITLEFGDEAPISKEKAKKNKKGTIEITYSKYTINKGVSNTNF